jgi:hypothetical protein
MKKTGEEAVVASFNVLSLYSPEWTEDNQKGLSVLWLVNDLIFLDCNLLGSDAM